MCRTMESVQVVRPVTLSIGWIQPTIGGTHCLNFAWKIFDSYCACWTLLVAHSRRSRGRQRFLPHKGFSCPPRRRQMPDRISALYAFIDSFTPIEGRLWHSACHLFRRSIVGADRPEMEWNFRGLWSSFNSFYASRKRLLIFTMVV